MSDETVVVGSHEERPSGFLGLMRTRNYALLWSGQFVSEMGNRFHWVAVSLWIYSLTQSAAAVSLGISSMFVGSLLVGLWAGVFVDRLNRKAILILSDLVRGVLVALIPSLIQVNLWLVYLDLALISVATAFFRPAIFAVVPQIVQRRELMAANSFFAAMDTGTEILGPVAAGFLAQGYGYAPLLYLDALSYGLSALCIFAMVMRPNAHPPRSWDLRAVWNGVVEGLRYIRRDELQRGLFVLIFPATLVGAGLNALQTPLAKGEIGISDAEFGTFQSVWGLGFVAASLLLGWYGAVFRKSRLIIGGYLLGFLSTALMGLSTGYTSLLLTAFAVGFANTLYYVGLGTVLMEYTPTELMGRVVSTRQVALASARVFSPLLFGAIAERSGVRPAILFMAAAGAVGTVTAIWRHTSVRQFDRSWKGAGLRPSLLLKPFVEPVDSEFQEAPQRWLNGVAMLVAFVAWMGVAVRSPVTAVVLLLATLALALVGSQLRRHGWLP